VSKTRRPGHADSYRSVLRNEPETAVTVGKWIAQTSQERRRLGAILGSPPTKANIKAMLTSLRDITATLAQADPTDRAAVYAEMAIQITYHKDGRVLLESRPRVVNDGVGGGT
jgi:site-specific DNA recombinase